MIIGIDPGNIESAIIVLHDGRIIAKDIKENYVIREYLRMCLKQNKDIVVSIELLASYGKTFGESLIQTAIETGKLIEICDHYGQQPLLLKRKSIVTHHLGTAIANDTDIRHAMIKRYGDPGTKKDPGLTYGIVRDMWQALAVASMAYDLKATATTIT